MFHSSLSEALKTFLKQFLLSTDLKFIISGHFTSSPYCVILQAREILRGRTLTENATICVFSNSTSQSQGVEFLPEPEKLRAGDERNNRKTKKVISNPATSGEMKVSSPINFVVQFPEEAKVLQNASDFARVVEPLQPVSDNKIK